jgi:alkylated DNA repair protein alkB family protein 1
MSLGANAIFLIGGPTRDVDPTPIILRSGDILVMSGASRLAYHGVPRIFPSDLPPLQYDPLVDPPETKLALEILGSARININIRQVL